MDSCVLCTVDLERCYRAGLCVSLTKKVNYEYCEGTASPRTVSLVVYTNRVEG